VDAVASGAPYIAPAAAPAAAAAPGSALRLTASPAAEGPACDGAALACCSSSCTRARHSTCAQQGRQHASATVDVLCWADAGVVVWCCCRRAKRCLPGGRPRYLMAPSNGYLYMAMRTQCKLLHTLAHLC
jgi:hypothetical protein